MATPPPISADPPTPPGPSAVPMPAALGVLRCGGAERERRLANLPVWALLLSVASSVWWWESAVKKRTRRPAAPSLWRTIRLPTPPALKMCVECNATETPQWRAGPEGDRTLCNACGVRHRAAGRFYGKLRGPRRPKAARGDSDSDSDYHQPTPTPEIPAASPQESQIWEGPILKGFFRAVRKRKSPATATTTEMEPATPPAMHPALEASPPTTAVDQAQKKKRTGEKKKQQKQCEHCGSLSTSKWRKGEMGMTLCNACGVRYNEGRLLPEYRPQGCPTFNKRMHATSHSEVLRLNRQRHLQLVQDSQDAYLMEDMLLDLPEPPPPSPAADAVYYLAGDDLRAAAAGDDSSANNNDVNAGASGSGTNDYPMMHLPPPPPPAPAEAEYLLAGDDLRAAAAAAAIDIDDDYSSANNVVNASGASGSGTNNVNVRLPDDGRGGNDNDLAARSVPVRGPGGAHVVHRRRRLGTVAGRLPDRDGHARSSDPSSIDRLYSFPIHSQ